MFKLFKEDEKRSDLCPTALKRTVASRKEEEKERLQARVIV